MGRSQSFYPNPYVLNCYQMRIGDIWESLPVSDETADFLALGCRLPGQVRITSASLNLQHLRPVKLARVSVRIPTRCIVDARRCILPQFVVSWIPNFLSDRVGTRFQSRGSRIGRNSTTSDISLVSSSVVALPKGIKRSHGGSFKDASVF